MEDNTEDIENDESSEPYDPDFNPTEADFQEWLELQELTERRGLPRGFFDVDGFP